MDNVCIMRKNYNTLAVMTSEWGILFFCSLYYPIRNLVKLEIVHN